MHRTRGALILGAVLALAGCGAGGATDSSPARDAIVLAGATSVHDAPATGTGSTPTGGTSGAPASSLGALPTAAPALSGSAGAAPGAGRSAAPSSAAPATSGSGAVASGPCTLARPAGAGAAQVDAATAGLSCAQATALLTTYLAAADDGTHGNTKALVVSGWGCQSPTAAESQTTGVLALCTKDGRTLSARAG